MTARAWFNPLRPNTEVQRRTITGYLFIMPFILGFLIPLAKPALITVGIFTFLNGWNDFIGPLLYINSPDKFTVAIGLATFRSIMRTRWDLLMAASTAMILPVLILFFFAQRYFIQGIVLSGLKG